MNNFDWTIQYAPPEEIEDASPGAEAFVDQRTKEIFVPFGTDPKRTDFLLMHELAHIEYGEDIDRWENTGQSILETVMLHLDMDHEWEDIEEAEEVLPETVFHLAKYIESPDHNWASLMEEAWATETSHQLYRQKYGDPARDNEE